MGRKHSSYDVGFEGRSDENRRRDDRPDVPSEMMPSDKDEDKQNFCL